MKRVLLGGLVLLCASLAQAAPWSPKKPKLVVVIAIDQFRADYISRFQHQFGKNGFNGLIQNGAYFPYGEYDVLQSMTAPGHATILSGSYPYQMGIPINEWFDQKTAKVEYCVEDETTQMVGTAKETPGSSPRQMVGDTVGDEMKNAGWPGKVVTLALKDRAAILMGGHRPDLAFWYDRTNKMWSSSTYYIHDHKLPAWLEKLNKDTKFAKCDFATPCGADATVEAFKAALIGERLGNGAGTDILAVSFSGHDFAGHHYGPNSEKMHEMTLAEDKALADLRQAVSAHVPGGLKNVTFVLTGDHGVSPTPNYLKATGIASDYIDEEVLSAKMDEYLSKAYGHAKYGKSWIAHVLDFNFFVDERNFAANKVSRGEVEQVIKTVLLKDGRFAQVVTRSEVMDHLLPPGMIGRKVEKTYYPGRSGLVIGIQKPFYINKTANEANHMTGYSYDRTVPIVFSGFGIKSGVFGDKAEVVDIAPTLSFLLGLLPPALSEGKVLTQALK